MQWPTDRPPIWPDESVFFPLFYIFNWPALASEARTVLKFQRIQTQGNVSLRECLIKQLLQALPFRMKRYRLKLPAQVAHMVLGMASLMQKADAEQGELFKQTVFAVTPVELCGWILADALYHQNFELLKAGNALGINTLALTSLRVPYMNKPFAALTSILPILTRRTRTSL